MKIPGFWILTFCTILLIPGLSLGQEDISGYSGRGVDFSRYQRPQPKASSLRWPKLLRFSADENKPRKERSFKNLFSKKQSSPLRKTRKDPIQDDDASTSRMFSGFGELFPKRDPDRPTMLEQWNAKSKSFFSKTTDWAQQTNDDLRSRTYDTWDTITRDKRKSDKTSESRSLLSRPPRRSADSLSKKPKIRF